MGLREIGLTVVLALAGAAGAAGCGDDGGGGETCGDETCGPDETCCTDCDGRVLGCHAACPGGACRLDGGRDAGGEDAGGDDASSGVCAPQEAAGEGMCAAAFGPFFYGSSCNWTSGCNCVGADCGDGYESVEDCERLNRGCIDGCGAQDAMGEGVCEALVGTFWDGDGCVTYSGCSCTGADCDQGYDDLAECMDAHRACTGTP